MNRQKTPVKSQVSAHRFKNKDLLFQYGDFLQADRLAICRRRAATFFHGEFFQQCLHFLATLCFLVYLSAALERQHPAYYIKVGLDVLLFAAITEALQYLTRDRTAGVADLRIDLYGMAFALLLFCLVRPLVRYLSSRSS